MPVGGSVIPLQGWDGTHARRCNPAMSRGKSPSPVEIQPETGESGQSGAGILALSPTLPSARAPLLSVAAVFFAYFLASFLSSLFLPFRYSFLCFFFSPFFLHLPSFCPNLLSLRFFSKSFFRRVKGWLRESLEVSFFFLSVHSFKCTKECIREAVQVRGFWPGGPLCRQGLGYDHDRMAAALR